MGKEWDRTWRRLRVPIRFLRNTFLFITFMAKSSPVSVCLTSLTWGVARLLVSREPWLGSELQLEY